MDRDIRNRRQRTELLDQAARCEAFAARLATLVERHKSAEQFAESMGASPSALRKWLKGQAEPRRDTLVALARAAGVSVEWLATGRGPKRPRWEAAEPPPGLAETGPEYTSASDLGGDYVLVPKYRAKDSTGGDAPTRGEQIVDHLAFKVDWIRRRFGVAPECLLLIEAEKDCPDYGFSKRDLLLLDADVRRIHDNALYVFDLNGDLVVRRIRKRLDATLIVLGSTGVTGTEEIAAGAVSSLPIVGRLLWFGRRV